MDDTGGGAPGAMGGGSLPRNDGRPVRSVARPHVGRNVIPQTRRFYQTGQPGLERSACTPFDPALGSAAWSHAVRPVELAAFNRAISRPIPARSDAGNDAPHAWRSSDPPGLATAPPDLSEPTEQPSSDARWLRLRHSVVLGIHGPVLVFVAQRAHRNWKGAVRGEEGPGIPDRAPALAPVHRNPLDPTADPQAAAGRRHDRPGSRPRQGTDGPISGFNASRQDQWAVAKVTRRSRTSLVAAAQDDDQKPGARTETNERRRRPDHRRPPVPALE